MWVHEQDVKFRVMLHRCRWAKRGFLAKTRNFGGQSVAIPNEEKAKQKKETRRSKRV